jgi:hypothetical protein
MSSGVLPTPGIWLSYSILLAFVKGYLYICCIYVVLTACMVA